MMRSLILSFSTLSLLVACAPEAEEKATAPTARTEQNAGGSLVACAGTDSTKAPAFESNTNLDGNVSHFMSAFQGGEKQSLCSILQSSGKEVALFQFVGVACLSCKDEAKDIQNRITASVKGAKMQHYIVFVDGQDTGVDAGWFEEFVRTNSDGKAIAKFEPEKTLMRRYNADPTGLKFGSVVAINKYGQAYYTGGIEGLPDLMAKADLLVP